MSGFTTKERNNNGEYEITFYTENRQDFEKVQDLCRELIGHGKLVSTEGDLISRSKLLISILAMIGHYNEIVTQDKVLGWVYGVDNCRELIENAPTVKFSLLPADESKDEAYMRGYEKGKIEGLLRERSKGEWIPVSERLPNRNGVYNVTRIIDETAISDVCYFDGQNTWHNDNRVNHGRPYLNDIIAWQPLPEPYKKDCEKNER